MSKTIQQLHHYGYTTHKVRKGEDISNAMYRAVRECHDFLTDDNHTWERKDDYIRIIRNEKSTPIPSIAPDYYRDSNVWFCSYFNLEPDNS